MPFGFRVEPRWHYIKTKETEAQTFVFDINRFESTCIIYAVAFGTRDGPRCHCIEINRFKLTAILYTVPFGTKVGPRWHCIKTTALSRHA